MLHWNSYRGLPFLCEPKLFEKGFHHGFIGRELDPGPKDLLQLKNFFCETFSVETLYLLNQVHGTAVSDFTNSLPEDEVDGDAIVVPRYVESSEDQRRAFGIVTADCLPILFVGETTVALVHAGWRGLASGVIENATRKLLSYEKGCTVKVFVGPAAGGEHYEVGEEVVDSLGVGGVVQETGSGKFLLDLGATAERKLIKLGFSSCCVLRYCTITDLRFHSHRRDGSRAGRNLLFIIQQLK